MLNNIKRIWNILNGIIFFKKNVPKHTNYPKYFIDNKLSIDNQEEVVDRFNNFFVSIGTNLEKQYLCSRLAIVTTSQITGLFRFFLSLQKFWENSSTTDNIISLKNTIYLATVNFDFDKTTALH